MLDARVYADGSCGAGCNAILRLRDLVTNTVSPYLEATSDHATINGIETANLSWVFPVTAGARTFKFEYATETGLNHMTIYSPTMTAMFVPFGSAGGTTLSATTGSAAKLGETSLGH